MERRKLEALAEAIVRTSGYWEANNALYFARNPGGLMAFAPTHRKTDDGFRVFESVLDGMQALMFDIQLKLSGKARTKLKPTDTVEDLAVACGLKKEAAVNWASFLRKGLKDEAISRKTALSYFIGEGQ